MMKYAIILAGAMALQIAGPALADPGHGHGNGHGNPHDYEFNGDVGHDRDGCPPGLAKKHNGCMPPGQARKLYRGERWQSGYGNPYGYGQIPYDLRRRYALNPRYRYYYSNGYLYAVDPETMLIAQVISALLR